MSVGVLYSDVIRERWRKPRYRGELPGATNVAEDVNPLCGDRVRLAVQVTNDTIETVRFTGDSCAICTASADVVAELATGRSTRDAAGLGTGEVLEVLRSDVKPTRMRCVTLPISVLGMALAR